MSIWLTIFTLTTILNTFPFKDYYAGLIILLFVVIVHTSKRNN
jgi:hypothetical protein